jgi:hypothetical protein
MVHSAFLSNTPLEETMRTVSKLVLVTSFLALGMPAANAQIHTPSPEKSTVDGAEQQNGQQKQDPKTTGAMDKAVGNLATSPDDVKRQTEGRPTAAEEAKGVTATAPKPEITQQSPGTVGAAPGTTAPMGEKKQ